MGWLGFLWFEDGEERSGFCSIWGKRKILRTLGSRLGRGIEHGVSELFILCVHTVGA